MAFADGFDMAYILQADLQSILQIDIPIVMLTDSVSFFDVISKATNTIEKRLMIDLQVFKSA